MRIGELSAKTGLSRDTIRFYEKQGLITSGESTSVYNHYREYGTSTVRKLECIRRIKDFGFTLQEVAGFLTVIEEGNATCQEVSQRFNDKVAVIDRKIAELQALKQSLQSGIENCPQRSGGNLGEKCPVFEIPGK